MKVGVSGHQEAPQSAWDFMTKHLRERFSQDAEKLIGVTSLAAGADQRFARIVLDMGGTTEVIIPCDGYESTFDSTDRAAFDALLADAANVTRLKNARPSEEAFLEAGRAVVDCVDLLVAVWDGEPARGLGGTGDIVRYARESGVPVEIVWPAGLRR